MKEVIALRFNPIIRADNGESDWECPVSVKEEGVIETINAELTPEERDVLIGIINRMEA